MVSTDHFRRGLQAQLARAGAHGSANALISATELHRMLGGYPGSRHGLEACCEAMQAEMQPGDDLLVVNGRSELTIRYQLPRTPGG
jgi:5-methylcytosine-specific restriction protein A